MTIAKTIKAKIDLLKEGEVFSANDFKLIGSQDNIRKILSRFCLEGNIKRLTKGFYLKPKKSNVSGKMMPAEIPNIIQALARKQNEEIIPHGANALRILGLSTQVPMKYIYYTSGYSRKITIEGYVIELRHAAPHKFHSKSTLASTVISALSYLGKENVSLETINTIKNNLNDNDFNEILTEVNQIPNWIASLFYNYQEGKISE